MGFPASAAPRVSPGAFRFFEGRGYRISPVSSVALIPLRDTIPTRTVPLVNGALIAACIGVWVVQLLAGSGGETLVRAFGFVPARLFHAGELGPGGLTMGVFGLFSSMFLHGGLLHLAGNMLFLWIFGDNVEDALGHGRYLLFYLGCGVLAALVQGLFATSSLVPMVGASGAIAGVLGAYFVLYPHARVVTLVPLFFLFPLVEVPPSSSSSSGFSSSSGRALPRSSLPGMRERRPGESPGGPTSAVSRPGSR